MIPFIKNDGGRKKAGLDHDKKSCTVRSLAIVAGLAYEDAYECCRLAGRKINHGISDIQIIQSLKFAHKKFAIRFEAIPAPRKEHPEIAGYVRAVKHGTFAQIARQCPKGRYLLTSRSHAFALVDGVLHDTFQVGARTQIGMIVRVTPADQGISALPTQSQINELWERLNRIEARNGTPSPAAAL